MGKRGPKPSGRVKVVVNTAIERETRDAIHQCAKQSGRSISGEIEYRLRRSFEEDRKVADIFGDRSTFAIAKLIASLMHAIRSVDRERSWQDDPYAYDQLLNAVGYVLNELRPPGAADRAPEIQQLGPDFFTFDPHALSLRGLLVAEARLRKIRESSPDLPPKPPLKEGRTVEDIRRAFETDKLTPAERRSRRAGLIDPYPYIKGDLGPLADRIRGELKIQGAVDRAVEELRPPKQSAHDPKPKAKGRSK